MINITQVKKVLRAIVAESPETVAACYYSEEGLAWKQRADAWRRGEEKIGNYVLVNEYPEPQPELITPICIVGHAVSRLSGTEGLSKLTEGDTADGVNNWNALVELGYSENAISFLRSVQGWQDSSYTWTQALELAENGA